MKSDESLRQIVSSNYFDMIELDPIYKTILLEALEDMMYKLSLQLDDLKGGPLDKERKEQTRKQSSVEELQRIISAA